MASPEISNRKSDKGPLVSVIIPTFNSSNTIRRALASACTQTYNHIEIIVADDASTDDTAEKVKAFGDPRIIFLESRQPKNEGPATTRNRALAHATGAYVAFLDSDDEWFPDKLIKQVAYLSAHPNCSIVISNAYNVAANGEIIGTEFDGPRGPVAGADAWRTLLKYSFISTPSVMTRLELVRSLGGFTPSLLVSQDQDLWIRLALEGEVGVIDDVLGKIYQVPTGHMARNWMRQVDIMLPMIKNHIERVAGRLSRSERNGILGYRYRSVGREMLRHGQIWLAFRLLTGACWYDSRYLATALLICQENPITQGLKSALKVHWKRLAAAIHSQEDSH